MKHIVKAWLHGEINASMTSPPLATDLAERFIRICLEAPEIIQIEITQARDD